MSKKNRKQLVEEFTLSYRSTGQLFYKLLYTAAQEKPDCNMSCLPILKVLKQRGSVSQSTIARELYHSDAAVSRQIGILVDDGLVSTSPDEKNRRVTLVKLTGNGKKMLSELETTMLGFMTEILSEMPEEELQQLIDSNNRLQEIITTKLKKENRV